MSRSRWIAGRATFTTVLSSMIMKRAKVSDASVHHFLFSSVSSRAFTGRASSFVGSGAPLR